MFLILLYFFIGWAEILFCSQVDKKASLAVGHLWWSDNCTVIIIIETSNLFSSGTIIISYWGNYAPLIICELIPLRQKLPEMLSFVLLLPWIVLYIQRRALIHIWSLYSWQLLANHWVYNKYNRLFCIFVRQLQHTLIHFVRGARLLCTCLYKSWSALFAQINVAIELARCLNVHQNVPVSEQLPCIYSLLWSDPTGGCWKQSRMFFNFHTTLLPRRSD